MSDRHQINPERGCGKKKEGAFYAENESSPGGALRMWTDILDDGGCYEEMAVWEVPSRQTIRFQARASLVACELIRMGDQFGFQDEKVDRFISLGTPAPSGRIPRSGLVDHVGANHYSAYSFRQEMREKGLSRRLPKSFALELARWIAEYGACPVFFTHSRIPVIGDNMAECEDILAECMGYNPEKVWRLPTWYHEGLTMYATKDLDSYSGHSSVLIPILSLVNQLDRNWQVHAENPAYMRALEFFD